MSKLPKRDDLILNCRETVDNLVKKYNNHKLDEDLSSVGMIAVVECVDRCLDDKMTNVGEIYARCNIWARNKILTEIYKEKIKYVDDSEDVIENYAAVDSSGILELDIKRKLTPRQMEVFELLVNGYNREEIKTELGIADRMYYNHVNAITEKILK